MEEIISFLNNFFNSEVEALKASDIPDLEDFNSKLELMNQFLIEPLKNKFGMIPLTELDDEEYYESVADYPAPDPRLLFRIDKYVTSNQEEIYLSYVSHNNPDGFKSYFNNFVIMHTGGKTRIHAKFNFSDRGMGIKKWYFGGGDDRFMKEVDGEFLLNEKSLGAKIEINRILEPSSNEDSMKEYNKE